MRTTPNPLTGPADVKFADSTVIAYTPAGRLWLDASGLRESNHSMIRFLDEHDVCTLADSAFAAGLTALPLFAYAT